ncbi:MAG TPA: hypothetical protein PK668_02495 [Myxococcota bacterium]|nr:hypothetical protein [Myxococcota bacterium]HRY94562.1 hypothetical protein [Myxococcota bacterium]HSA20172.1 hypothetical protein [Myxococcota bacterium]
MRRILMWAVLGLALSACGAVGAQRPDDAPPTSARGGYTFDLHDQVINPSTPMIAKPLAGKLFVIIDPGQVEDAFLIDNSTHGVVGFRAFLEAGLRRALAGYFSELSFVAPGFAFPDSFHYVAQARADRISSKNMVLGYLTHAVLEMNWAFAIRPSTQADYRFSFSGVAQSEVSYETLWIGAQQLLTSAMNGLLTAWTDKNVYQALAETAAPGGAADPGSRAGAAAPIVLAVFDVQDASRNLDQDTLVQLTTYLSTLLVQDGRFSVVPRDQLRLQLLDEKKGSYRQCMEEGCQIELGKALAAQGTLSTTLIKVGGKCVITSTLFDLKTETARRGATAETGCATEELLEAMRQIARQL